MSDIAPFSNQSPMPKLPPWHRSWFPLGPDWRNLLCHSQLPDEIQDIIGEVVKKSRLMRREKVDVATDLISHFQDGVNKGQSYLQIAEEFGDPAVTATLIRRSKLRSRPMLMKMFRGLGMGAGVLSVAYLAMMAYFHTGSPKVSFDYLGELNKELVDLAPEQKAWNLYRPAWTKFGFSEGGGCELFKDIFVEDEEGVSHLAKPLDEDWPVAIASLEEHSELLGVLRMGAMLPVFGLELQANPNNYSAEDFAALFPGRDQATWEHSWGIEGASTETEELMKTSLIGVLLPHVQSFRGAARAFHVDTRLAYVQGDSDRVVENVETIMGIARQCSDAKLLVCSLVSYAVAAIGFDQLEEVLASDPDFFSDEQLAKLQVAIEDADVRGWLHFDGERAFMKDIVQRTYTDNGDGDGRMTPTGLDVIHYCQNMMSAKTKLDSKYYAVRNLIGPTALVTCASRKETTDMLDKLVDQSIADASLPHWLSKGTGAEEFLKNNKFKHVLLGMMFPATDQIRDAMDRTMGRQEGVITALAIHRFYKKHGEWPSDFDQISPEFIAQFPIDVIDGSLVKFKYDDDQLIVYSIGNDLDDDGGVDPESVSNGERERSTFTFAPAENSDDGDWILWPQSTIAGKNTLLPRLPIESLD